MAIWGAVSRFFYPYFNVHCSQKASLLKRARVPQGTFCGLGSPFLLKVPLFYFLSKERKTRLHALLNITSQSWKPVILLFLMGKPCVWKFALCWHFASNSGRNQNWTICTLLARSRSPFSSKLGPLLIPFLNIGCKSMLFFNIASVLRLFRIFDRQFLTIFWLSRTERFRIPQIGR